MDVAVALATFVLIVPVELPDKTFIATLVLATRYGPLATWIGVGLAFGVQTVVAVLAGGLIAQLPTRPVTAAAAAMFAIGAVVLWRGAARADEQEAQIEREFAGKVSGRESGEESGEEGPQAGSQEGTPAAGREGGQRVGQEAGHRRSRAAGPGDARGTSPLRRVTTSFTVLFIAEWGDLSQLLTAGLVVRYDDPVSVFVGAWSSLLVVSALGALLGRALLKRVRLGAVQRVGAGVCALLAVLAALSVAGVETV